MERIFSRLPPQAMSPNYNTLRSRRFQGICNVIREPLLYRRFARTIFKRYGSDRDHARRNFHALKASAIGECPFPDMTHPIRYMDAFQAQAFFKRPISNESHTGRELHAPQSLTIRKCTFLYGSHTGQKNTCFNVRLPANARSLIISMPSGMMYCLA